jgi:hypothetical protein
MRSTAQASATPAPSGCSARACLRRTGGGALARAALRAGRVGRFLAIFFFVFFEGAMASLRGAALGPERGI